MAEQIGVRFTADTGDMVANIKKATASTEGLDETVRATKARILQSWKEQIAAAKQVGASQEEISAITTRAQQMLSQTVEQNTTRIARSLSDASSRNKRLADQWQADNNRIVESENAKARAIELAALRADILSRSGQKEGGGGHTVSGQSAASGAVQLLEGRNGIRSIENFLGTTLGFGGFFSLMFPAVGAIQSAKLLVDLGEELYSIRDKAVSAAAAISQAFAEQHSHAAVSIDDLTIQADKLQTNIDKLSGHPGNGLKTALDEARAFADKLQASLLADRKELEALFQAQHVGTFASLLSGVAPTGTQEKELLKDHADIAGKIAAANSQFNADSANAKTLDDIKKAGEKRDNAIRAAIQGTINTYRAEAVRLRDEQTKAARETAANLAAGGESSTTVNNSAKIANVEGVAGKYSDFLNQFNAQQNVASLTAQENALKGQQEAGRLATEANRKLLEAQKQAMDLEHAQWQQEAERSASDEVMFWESKADAAKAGSALYLSIQEKIASSISSVQRETARVQKDNAKILNEMQNDSDKRSDSATAEYMKKDAEATKQWTKELLDLAAAQQRWRDQLAQAGIEQDASTGKISKAEEAAQLSALHTREYAAALAELQATMARLQALPGGRDTDAKTVDVQKQIADLNGQRAVQVMHDNAQEAAASWQGALTNANRLWVQNAMDSAAQVRELYQSTLGALNQSISELATGGKANFGAAFKGIGKNVFSVGLQHIEGAALGGKSDGSKANPFHVIIDSAGNKMFTASPTDVAKVGDKAMDGALNWGLDKGWGNVMKPTGANAPSSGGGFGSTLSSLASLIPGGGMLTGFFNGLFGGHKALGGRVQAGMTYDVGEMGREEFTPDQDGSITPNNKLGSTAYYNISVPNGVTPEAMHQFVKASLAAVHPQVVRSSVQAMQEMQKRRPLGTRA